MGEWAWGSGPDWAATAFRCLAYSSRMTLRLVDDLFRDRLHFVDGLCMGGEGDRFVARKRRSLLAMTGHMSFQRKWHRGPWMKSQ
jgi:hypothetical protein